MSIRLQHLREAFSFLSTFTGRIGEIVVDTTNNRLQVHDGVTAGGWPAAKLSEVVTNTRVAVSDSAYTALATDRTVAYTAITAARIVTLPASASYPTGTTLTVVDESGSCSATKTITLSRAGTDTIDGAASVIVSAAYGYLSLQSNGAGKWTIVDQAASNLTAVGIGTAADPNNPLSVYGTSALFNSAGNFNFTINKAAPANTASTIYEDGFSPRAQIGLCGDDNFHFKVSPTGAAWYDALDIIASSGLVTANFGIAIGGSTSGTTSLQAQAAASGTLTLPSATDTLVGRTTTDTLINKTLTSPTISGGTIDTVVIGSTVPAAASFTTLLTSSIVRLNGLASLPPGSSGGILGAFASSGPGCGFQFTDRASVGSGWLWYATGGLCYLYDATTPANVLSVTAGTSGTLTYQGYGNFALGLQIGGAAAVGSDRSIYLGSFTVGTLPAAGHAGRTALPRTAGCSMARARKKDQARVPAVLSPITARPGRSPARM